MTKSIFFYKYKKTNQHNLLKIVLTNNKASEFDELENDTDDNKIFFPTIKLYNCKVISNDYGFAILPQI